MAATSSERTLAASIAAHESWAHTSDRSARTAPARAALLARFEREVDPDNILSPDERARRAESKRRAYFQRLSLKSAKARRARSLLVVVAEGEAAEAELAEFGGAPPSPAGNLNIRRNMSAEAVSQPRPDELDGDAA
ncbi:hypothetical protein BH11ACT1_BH11ACT1_18170 [soil metagenome]